ncbi:MAG: site-2 protease family protein [Planctomycetaceae bacterium]|jgi:regulator of sigma E protease|nr:site-2 protease family protein [Planctomycetaceae bacterium]
MDISMTLLGVANIQPTIFATIINVTIKVLLVIAGINALIIVHEFGHFIVARLCGVRCEKFYIWFDFYGLRFFKFKWGDTEYGLGLFPLGGYVKMLGQEDNPGELRAEFERAKIQNNQFDQTQDEEPRSSQKQLEIDKETQSQTETRSPESLRDAIFAPDSYLSKSVPQRLAIIVAGVVMNFIFAVVCASAAYVYGVVDTAPVVGNIVPGSPAWEVDMKTGDKIKSINGKTVRTFMDISMASINGTEGLEIEIERELRNENNIVELVTVTKNFKPRKRPNDIAPMIAISPCIKMTLSGDVKYPVDPNWRKFYLKETLEKLKFGNLRLTNIGEKNIGDYGDYLEASLENWGKPVEMTFVREKTASGAEEQVKVTIPAIPAREVGLRFKMGGIASVHPESEAAKKGIQVGDEIVAIDDVEEFDPLKLSYIVLQKINAGQKDVRLKIKKSNSSGKGSNNSSKGSSNSSEIAEAKVDDAGRNQDENSSNNFELIILALPSTRIIPQLSPLSMQDPLGSSALGLAWNIEPVVAGYLPDAPEKVKAIPIGSKIISVKLINGVSMLSKNSFSYTEKDGVVFHDVGDRVGVPYIFDFILQLGRTKASVEDKDFGMDDTTAKKSKDAEKKLSVQFEVINPDGKNELFPADIYESAEYFRVDRGLMMSELKTTVTAAGFGEALGLGFAKTVEYSLSVYVTLKRFYDGTVSPRALGGPILVVQSAYSFVSRGMGTYLLFLCIISANLAVVNLLPIPPLDGGHVVFLAYEGIVGRPPNIIVQALLSWAGLLLIILLGLWVIALDCAIIPRF